MWVWNLADCCDALWEDSRHFPLPAAGGSMGKSIITHLSSPTHVLTSRLLRPVYFKSSIPVLQSCLYLKTWCVVHHFWTLILIKKTCIQILFLLLTECWYPPKFCAPGECLTHLTSPCPASEVHSLGHFPGVIQKMIVVLDSVSIILFLSITPY